MRNRSNRKRIVLLTLLLAAVVSGVLGAEILRWTVDGGGSPELSGGDFGLSATVGQPDAGTLTGGVFTLTGGFWGPYVPPEPTGAHDWMLHR
ncbi:hypothetical protein JW916_01305 [Candidatus Sumerlaeota bacterium]|nr:hypothetical protein [Candidatus Sumerlaeota bacterium]